MSNKPIQVLFAPVFERNLKKLAKKYPRIKSDLQPLIESLETGELPGDKIQGTGYAVFKERIPNTDANRGKSGGYRVIYYLIKDDTRYLITIYCKSEQSDINVNEIIAVIEEILEED